jgi:hypothetical protein
MRKRRWQETGEDCIMRSFITCTMLSGDQIKEEEMGGLCSTHGVDAKLVQNFGR